MAYAYYVVVKAGELITTNATHDYTLFTIPEEEVQKIESWVGPNGETIPILDIEPSKPVLNQTIYIPQHPSGGPLQLAIKDDHTEAGRDCMVNHEFPWNDVTLIGYSCDTMGGSSGSPVLDRQTHKVVAIHAYGGCPEYVNGGYEMHYIYPQIEQYLDSSSGSGNNNGGNNGGNTNTTDPNNGSGNNGGNTNTTDPNNGSGNNGGNTNTTDPNNGSGNNGGNTNTTDPNNGSGNNGGNTNTTDPNNGSGNNGGNTNTTDPNNGSGNNGGNTNTTDPNNGSGNNGGNTNTTDPNNGSGNNGGNTNTTDPNNGSGNNGGNTNTTDPNNGSGNNGGNTNTTDPNNGSGNNGGNTNTTDNKTPQDCIVTAYKEQNYEGDSIILVGGNLPQVWDNSISSLKIQGADDCQVILFQLYDYRGRRTLFTKDTPVFDNYDNDYSSVLVQHKDQCHYIAYDQTNFEGESFAIEQNGNFDFDWRNRIKSIKIEGEDCEIGLYEGTMYKYGFIILYESASDLADYGFDGSIKSAWIY